MWLALHGDREVDFVEPVDRKDKLVKIGHDERICGEQENFTLFSWISLMTPHHTTWATSDEESG